MCGGWSGIGEGVKGGRFGIEVEDRVAAGSTDEGTLVLEEGWIRLQDEEGQVGIMILDGNPRVLTRSLLTITVVLPVQPVTAAPATILWQRWRQWTMEGEVGVEGASSHRALQSRMFDQIQFELNMLAIDAEIQLRQERFNSSLQVGAPLLLFHTIIAIGVEVGE